MKTGINWSGQRDLPTVASLLGSGEVDFVEIVIDNFLPCDPGSLLSILDGTPCAFHIMNSRFLHARPGALRDMAKRVRELDAALSPLYVSDHLGKFYFRGQALPQMLEVDYVRDGAWCRDKLALWQDLLGRQIFIENYPSIIRQPAAQAAFFARLIEATQCGLLFDISNAVIAEINTGESAGDWSALWRNTRHFHIGGFAPAAFSVRCAVDTHDRGIDERALLLAEVVLGRVKNVTVSVERDDRFDAEEWLADVRRIGALRGDL
ncbi:multinuclear nonheme iron-dependent oxidase [Paludibacterium paludis]|uniref:UPF0276 protein n=1 Tax=Paludibacterium paludis TaxID=1225769 RepID=A0A918U9L0_9NEIS|nr:DUF692 family multinuclear iron-containing protein [Paludibacterium paludis]GGY16465.1 UPF0276 protein [Paludibacterium paludis]